MEVNRPVPNFLFKLNFIRIFQYIAAKLSSISLMKPLSPKGFHYFMKKVYSTELLVFASTYYSVGLEIIRCLFLKTQNAFTNMSEGSV